jgi:hypothetical protein
MYTWGLLEYHSRILKIPYGLIRNIITKAALTQRQLLVVLALSDRMSIQYLLGA